MMMIAVCIAAVVQDAPRKGELELPTVTITRPKPKQQEPYQFTVIRDADDGLVVLTI